MIRTGNPRQGSLHTRRGEEGAESRAASLASAAAGPLVHDPELLYVECSLCGRPVLWEKGLTTKVLTRAGVRMDVLDARCMILSAGCPMCKPNRDFFNTQLIRLKDNDASRFLTNAGGLGQA